MESLKLIIQDKRFFHYEDISAPHAVFKPGAHLVSWNCCCADVCMCVFVCVCVCLGVCLPQRLLITSGMMWYDIDSL